MYWLWECLKLLFVGILAIIALIVINILIFGTFISFSNNDTSNTNKQVVDAYTVEEQKDDTDYITSEDLQIYKESLDYVPGKANPFSN